MKLSEKLGFKTEDSIASILYVIFVCLFIIYLIILMYNTVKEALQ